DAVSVGVRQGLGHLHPHPGHAAEVLRLRLAGQLRTTCSGWLAGARTRLLRRSLLVVVCRTNGDRRGQFGRLTAPKVACQEPLGDACAQPTPGRGAGLSGPACSAVQLLQLAQDEIEPLSLDELHRVVMNALVLAHAEDGDDV